MFCCHKRSTLLPKKVSYRKKLIILTLLVDLINKNFMTKVNNLVHGCQLCQRHHDTQIKYTQHDGTRHNGTQHNNIKNGINNTQPNAPCHYAMLRISYCYAECRYAESRGVRPKTVKAYYSYRKRSLYSMQCKAKCNRLVYFFVLIFFDRQCDHKIGKNHPIFWKVAKKVQNIYTL
jgi:hypothetical protein